MAPRFLAAGLTIFALSINAVAQELIFEDSSQPSKVGTVAVEKQEDFSSSYKKRRSLNGALFSIASEKFYPVDYRSLFNDAYIKNIIGENDINLIGIELGYKRNMGFLSASALGSFSEGSIDGAVTGAPRTLKISKQGISANVAVDGIFEEPYIVPYVQAGAHQFNISEAGATGSQSGTTSISFNYKYGILFQLDWIENRMDKTAKEDRLRSSGLENTYIDIYFAEYLASGNAIDPATLTTDGDPNMFSSGGLGIGLKMEF